MNYLFEHGILHPSGNDERLTIVMDNCSGQNKNNVVLRLAPYISKMNYFRTVEFVFYVCGHTKNVCDRLFNQMKIWFHKGQVHSYHVALEILDEQPNVHIINATEEVFKDFGKMLDSFYSTFENGTICVNHIFKFDKEEDVLEMQCYAHDYTEVVHQPILKHGFKLGQKRLTALKTAPMETLNPPGLIEIKQMEFFKKRRKYADPRYWDERCPEPSSVVIDQVKKDKLEKRVKTTEQQKGLSEKRREVAQQVNGKKEQQDAKRAELTRKKADRKLRVHQKNAADEEKQRNKDDCASAVLA
jgi:hypothetical protein